MVISDSGAKIAGISQRIGLGKSSLITCIILYPLLYASIKTAHFLFIRLFDFKWDEFPGVLQQTGNELAPVVVLFATCLLLITVALYGKRFRLAAGLAFLALGRVVWQLDFLMVSKDVVLNLAFDLYALRLVQLDILGFLASTPVFIIFCWVTAFIYQKAYHFGGVWGLLFFSAFAGLLVPVVGMMGATCYASLVGPVQGILKVVP